MLDGTRVPKSSLAMEQIGNVDELNSSIGTFIFTLKEPDKTTVKTIMHKLFDIGSILATTGNETFNIPVIKDEDITLLEKEIDRLMQILPPLKNFILPTGNIHLSRSICRRAERSVSHRTDAVSKYINRLSDYLFALARYYNYYNNEEILWEPSFS